MIDSLEANEIFVFGSNGRGEHLGGAAKQAYEQFGAQWGIANGLTGRCYAIDTMSGWNALVLNVEQFIRVARETPHLTYLLTAVGTGIAGYSANEVSKLFTDVPSNVILPDEFTSQFKQHEIV